MKLTNGEIYNVKEPLQRLSAMQFPVKTSLALIKLAKKLNEFAIPIEQVRMGLIKQYGKPSEGNPQQFEIKPGDENWEKFIQEYKELMEQEVEVVFEQPVIPESLEISPVALMALEKFIKVA